MAYNQGKIYQILDSDSRCRYVGSTAKSLKTRWASHVHNSPTYRMELVEDFPCNSRFELETREEYWRKQLNPPLNKKRCSAGIPGSLYRTDVGAYLRQWRRSNPRWSNKVYCPECRKHLARNTYLYYHKNTIAHYKAAVSNTINHDLYLASLPHYRRFMTSQKERLKGGPPSCRRPCCPSLTGTNSQGYSAKSNEITVAKSIGNQWNLSTFSDYFLTLLLLSAIFASRPQ